ncbi:winged helix-turn-helix domain-containing protein, partial [bacterium D16-59]
RGMRDLFYRIGLSYTRPTYTLNKADSEKQDAWSVPCQRRTPFPRPCGRSRGRYAACHWHPVPYISSLSG